MPREWAYSTARETSAGCGRPWGGKLVAARLWPSTNSIAINVLVADVADPKMPTMPGWRSEAAVWASRREADELLLAAGAEEDLEGRPSGAGRFPRL